MFLTDAHKSSSGLQVSTLSDHNSISRSIRDVEKDRKVITVHSPSDSQHGHPLDEPDLSHTIKKSRVEGVLPLCGVGELGKKMEQSPPVIS